LVVRNLSGIKVVLNVVLLIIVVGLLPGCFVPAPGPFNSSPPAGPDHNKAPVIIPPVSATSEYFVDSGVTLAFSASNVDGLGHAGNSALLAGSTVWTDLTRSGSNGTLVGGTTWHSLAVVGTAAALDPYALLFYGVNYISTPATIPSPGPLVFSQDIWFKTAVPGGTLATYTNGVLYDRTLSMDGSGNLSFAVFNIGTGLKILSTSGTNFADNNWHQVVATFDN
jgi:hypothetical protein